HHPPLSPLRSSLPSAQITLFALTLPLLVAILQLNYAQVQARKHHARLSSVTARGTSSSSWSQRQLLLVRFSSKYPQYLTNCFKSTWFLLSSSNVLCRLAACGNPSRSESAELQIHV
ncbi:hypothetical protein B0H14DRAFT_3869652, partial [Mycena olivaceomarginata]